MALLLLEVEDEELALLVEDELVNVVNIDVVDTVEVEAAHLPFVHTFESHSAELSQFLPSFLTHLRSVKLHTDS